MAKPTPLEPPVTMAQRCRSELRAQHLAEARRSVSSLDETSKFNQSDRLLFLPALRPAPPLPFKHKYRVHAPG